ncbi:MAG: immune inhibitor A [Bacteroidales bacterium]|nr:immune inhibitor A [Bacteroidales bacterium]
MKKIAILLCFCFFSSFLVAQSTKYSEVKIHLDQKGMLQLSRLGLAIEDGTFSKDGIWTTVLSSEELKIVKSAGFSFEILHEDYSRFIESRNRGMLNQIDYINTHKATSGSEKYDNYPVPQHFRLGSMGGFLTLDEVNAQLDSMQLLYPGLISVKAPAGNFYTIEGRPIYYVRISNNPGQLQSKPRVFYNALIHAREPMGMQQLIFYMWYLLENYNTNSEIKYLVDNLEMYFIPVINPDGYEFNHQGFPIGGGQWRKNRRDNGSGVWGVDLNRNFGYKWGYDNFGSSPNSGDETYRGASAFSEPETQIIRDFCNEMDFRITMNYHTFSDYLLYPWCYQTIFNPDSMLQVTYARFLQRQNGFLSGMPGQVLYNTNGDAMDWEYGEQTTKPKTICFTAEVGTDADGGFWPFVSRIIPLAQENVYSNLMIAHFALRYAEINDLSPVILSSRKGKFGFEFVRYGLDGPADYQVSIHPVDTSQFVSVGGAKMFVAPEQFQSYPDSIDYELIPSVTSGDKIQFVYDITNGLFTFHDTVTKFYGPPLVVFHDSCNNMQNWTTDVWDVTHLQFHSAPKSITDSPTGNYSNNSTVSVTTINEIDLQSSPVVVINYWAKWNTEKGYDFVQFKLSGDNGPWTPQRGKYSTTGTPGEIQYQPVYDGTQLNWIKDQIVSTNYPNKDLKMQFVLESDAGSNYDGFYFDDVSVTIVDMSYVGIGAPSTPNNGWISDPIPNPASSQVSFRWHNMDFGESHDNAIFTLLDSRGIIVKSFPVPDKMEQISFTVNNLTSGIYFYRITDISGSTAVKKLVVIH